MSPFSLSPAPHLAGLTVAAVMHPGTVTVPDDATVREVAATMAAHQIHAILLDDGASPRIVTDLDLLAAAVAQDGQAQAGRSGRAIPIVESDTRLDAAVEAMVQADVTHAFVRAAGAGDRTPAGMLSALDVAAVVAGLDPHAAGLPRPRPARPSLSERRLERVAARDVMHAGLIGVAPDTPVRRLAATLAEHRIHCATVVGTRPAVGGERLVWAIASEMDVLRATAAGALEATASDVAGSEPLVVAPDDRLDVVAARMVDHGVAHVVVAWPGETPAGVVSTLDVMSVLGIDAM